MKRHIKLFKQAWRAIFTIVILMYLIGVGLAHNFNQRFDSFRSSIIYDRHGKIIAILPNKNGNYSRPIDKMPLDFEKLLLEKEDKYFYFHIGVNPVSTIRALWHYLIGGRGGGSTITQQLTKIVLGNERERTLGNKLVETFYALSLEMWESKRAILDMYEESVYLGNLTQGFAEGAYVYYNKPINDLDESGWQALINTLSNPSVRKPQASGEYKHNTPTFFELGSASLACTKDCTTTIDLDLTIKLREIVKRYVNMEYDRGVKNGVLIVLKEPENEILALIGSPDPESTKDGAKINMAIEPRPIGSTVKPLIYARAFEKGMRPYTKIEDREYRYNIGTGFALYPKNYDGKYHGTVTTAESLANSLNVPAVKTLEYVGLADFYNLLTNKLSFHPLADLSTYQLGIALGGLEMDPLTLAHYLSTFVNSGELKPLKLINNQTYETPMSRATEAKQIFDPSSIALINKILSDRTLSVDQFGAKSSLNLPQNNYAVKTGTSRDYHDSWTVGWTPDYLVLAWVGNAENTALNQVSGQSGAGDIWHEAMSVLANSEYNKNTPFDFSTIKNVIVPSLNNANILTTSWGLPGDIVSKHIDLLFDKTLITSPHEGDIFDLTQKVSIPLVATEDVDWHVNNAFLGHSKTLTFSPSLPGRYNIRATDGSGYSQTVSFVIE
ncbi:MAG TPA: transglycosylase domain-containing protein [Candidatus Paceibacterota bacterium]